MYKTNTNQRPTTKKWLLIAIAAILLLAVGGVIFAKMNAPQSDKNSNGLTPETIKYNEATKQEKQEAEDAKTGNNNGDKTQGSDPVPARPPVETKVAITSAKQDATTKDLVVQTRLEGQGWTKCTLTVSQGSATVTKTADALFQSDFSTCMGFVVKNNELAAGGEWKITLQVSNSNGPTETAEQTINITKE